MNRKNGSGRAAALLLVVAACFAGVGCQTTAKKDRYIDVTTVPLRDDIVQIVQFWPQVPWLRGVGDVVTGFKVTTLFVSSETEKGVFVPGKIMVWLYELTPKRGRGYEREFLHSWQLDQEQAMPYRVRILAIIGYQYGLVLAWPPDVDVEGKLVEFEIGYERIDGKLIVSPPHRYRIPVGPNWQPPANTSRAATAADTGRTRKAPSSAPSGTGPG